MKRLILVGGPMGVGKSAVCGELLKLLSPAVYLDGDWCWNMHPFTVTEETRAMVMDNICAMLGRFLTCPEIDDVIFGWVMHRQDIIDELCRRLPLAEVSVKNFSLTASSAVLEARLAADVAAGRREEDVIPRSLAYLPLYEGVDSRKVCTDRLTPRQAAELLRDLMEEEAGA